MPRALTLHIALLAGLGLISGCQNISESNFSSSRQWFGYPSVMPAAFPSGTGAATSNTTLQRSPVGAATTQEAVIPVPAVREAPLPVYDHEKDPYVTAVLVSGPSNAEMEATYQRTPSGMIILPKPADIPVIEIRDIETSLKDGAFAPVAAVPATR